VNNLVVPVVGDFADQGDPRRRRYLKDHNATVTAFYLSNVEQYLFNQERLAQVFGNVGRYPRFGEHVHPLGVQRDGIQPGRAGMRAQQMLASMLTQLRLFNEGRLASYYDVIQTSR
jgi:hypothetical protein